MKIFALLPALAALVTSVAGIAIRDDTCNSEICAGPSKRDFIEHPSRTIHGLTNAELLRRGLPLNNPIMRRGSPVRRQSPSSVPPPVKTTHAGVVEVHNAADGSLLGYIGKDLLNGAQLGFKPSIADALLISFETDSTGSGTDIDISMTNSNPSWPLLGLIQGRDDTDSNFAPGSYQYGYLGGVANPGTQPGDGPTLIDNSYPTGTPRTAETAVWTFDGTSGTLTPVWINEDGTTPALQTWTQSTALYIGGDQSAFHSRYPAPVTGVTYKFVPQ
jgi:hypothetical protein